MLIKAPFTHCAIPRVFRSTTNSRCSFSSSSHKLKPFRILLFGSDQFSCATLNALIEARQELIDQIIVLTPPDSRTGRGLKLIHRPPLRLLAESLNLETIALPSSELADWRPPASFLSSIAGNNLLLTASYGHLIPTALLSLFDPSNALNVHPSLLPKYRGAAPIQWAIINGDGETGVTVQELSKGLFDRGRILGQRRVDIPIESTFTLLEPILAQTGGDLLVSVLRDLITVQSNAVSQDASLASAARKISKELARIDWRAQTAEQIIRLHNGIGHQFSLRTMTTDLSPLEIQLTRISCIALDPPRHSELLNSPPGTVQRFFDDIVVRCSDSSTALLRIERIKPAGGKEMSALDWWNGRKGKRNGEGTADRFM